MREVNQLKFVEQWVLMFLGGLLRPLDQLFVPTPFALPGGKDCVGISGALVNGTLRGNDLSAAPWTRPSSRRPFFNVDIFEWALIFHDVQVGPERLN